MMTDFNLGVGIKASWFISRLLSVICGINLAKLHSYKVVGLISLPNNRYCIMIASLRKEL